MWFNREVINSHPRRYHVLYFNLWRCTVALKVFWHVYTQSFFPPWTCLDSDWLLMGPCQKKKNVTLRGLKISLIWLWSQRLNWSQTNPGKEHQKSHFWNQMFGSDLHLNRSVVFQLLIMWVINWCSVFSRCDTVLSSRCVNIVKSLLSHLGRW